MATSQVQLAAAGNSTAVPIDLKKFKFGVGLLVNVPTTASVTYNVQVTGDDPAKYPTITGVWNLHDCLQGMTASANGNLAYPVTKVRLQILNYGGTGNVTLSVIQVDGSI